nr:MAG TPA: hypothetical protein [Caudoviricetes sp.]
MLSFKCIIQNRDTFLGYLYFFFDLFQTYII